MVKDELKNKNEVQKLLKKYQKQNNELEKELLNKNIESKKEKEIINSNLNNEISEKLKLIEENETLCNCLIEMKEEIKNKNEMQESINN
jgi:hypothetical protein